jgi:hypothetical protein
MRAATSARVLDGGRGAVAGGGAEGPALSRKKYGEIPVLAAVLKGSAMVKPGGTSSSSSLTASSAGAARVWRNQGSSGGATVAAGEAVMGDSIPLPYSRVCGVVVYSLQKSHQKGRRTDDGDIGSMGT